MLRPTDEAFIRMKEEYKELKIKVDTLDEYIRNARLNKFTDITLDEIHLMEEQAIFMLGYLNTLKIRIYRVEGKEL